VKAWTLKVGLPVAVWTVLAASAYGNPIFVNNFSFETLPIGGLPDSCGTACTYSIGSIPGWTNTGTSSGQMEPGPPTNTTYFNSVPDGSVIGFTNLGTISQTVGPTVIAGNTYTLTVDIGQRADEPGIGTAALLINGNTYLATGTAPTLGNWSVYTATYTSLSADIGDSISIVLSANGPQGDFDNVQLNSALFVAPEPSTSVLLGLGLALVALSRTVRRKRA